MKRTVAIIGLGLAFVAAHNAHAQTRGDIMRDTADCIDAYHADKSQDAESQYLRCLARVQDEEDEALRRAEERARDARYDSDGNSHHADDSPLTTPADFARKALSLLDTCHLDADPTFCPKLTKAMACKADTSLCGVDDMNVLRVRLTAIIPKQPTDADIKAWAKKVSECHCDVPMPTSSAPVPSPTPKPDSKPDTKPESKPDTKPADQTDRPY